MIPVAISYFDVSAEQKWGGELGHHIQVGYSADIPQSIAESQFDLLEEVAVVMEWKVTVDGTETLKKSREFSAFPRERISIIAGGQIVRHRKLFLTRDDLRWERGFPEMAEINCRISLIPLLAAARRSILVERIEGRYRAIPSQLGFPPNSVTPGYEF